MGTKEWAAAKSTVGHPINAANAEEKIAPAKSTDGDKLEEVTDDKTEGKNESETPDADAAAEDFKAAVGGGPRETEMADNAQVVDENNKSVAEEKGDKVNKVAEIIPKETDGKAATGTDEVRRATSCCCCCCFCC